MKQQDQLPNLSFQCVGQTWYLDNDMQMFLVTPLIIYPLWRLKIWGFAMACEFFFLSFLLPYLVLTLVCR